MAYAASTAVARQLGSLFEGGSAAGLSDGQLVERFVAARDESAFAALVSRHGPMVLGVCRQLLGDSHAAEDAFQAVFLVLARKASGLRQPELLGNWLYGVALRTARKASVRTARLRRTEEDGAARRPEADATPSADRTLLDHEQAEALHVEIDRLPGAFRAPVVLCYFEGLTLDEAARRLRWPVGTTRSRLARARDKLRRGLTRRGVALPATALAAALAPRSASASVPPLLCESTARAAIAFAARSAASGASSAPAAAIAQEVLRAMLAHQLRSAALPLLFLASLAGILIPAFGAFAAPREGEPPGEPNAQEARHSVGRGAPDPQTARMTVDGRVTDPQGRPLPGARVAVLADRRRLVNDIDGGHRNILMGTAAADADGRFTLEFPGIPADRLEHLRLVAAAPGRALTVSDLKTGAAHQEATIALPPEEPVVARLVDVQGQPAAGVVVRVGRLSSQPELRPPDAKGSPFPWPSPATTDANGRFRMLGLGANARATFVVEDPRYARHAFSFHAGNNGPSEEVIRTGSTVTLRPAQSLEVRAVRADDGKPMPGARAEVQATGYRNGFYLGETVRVRTDGQGRARVVPWPGGEYRVYVYPPDGEPYVPAWLDLDWPKAAVRHSFEVKLRRGAIVRGRVVEGPSATPIPGVWVVYHQVHRNNPRYRNLPEIQAVSGADGTFTLVVPHGPGLLLAQAPTPDYLHTPVSFSEMGVGIRPSFHMYPDAHARLDIPEDEATHPVELRLRRGVTITGRVLTPDGRPVAEAFAVGRSYTPYEEGHFPLVPFNGMPPMIPVKDGRFEIPGCDPEHPGTFYFLDTKDRLGATVELSGQATAGPVTVTLQPTASARLLLKGADGRPAANREAYMGMMDLRLIITPGPDFEKLNGQPDLTPGDFVYHVNIDRPRIHELRSGPDGRVTIPALIPGAPYRFHSREFRPRPGETIDLGEAADSDKQP